MKTKLMLTAAIAATIAAHAGAQTFDLLFKPTKGMKAVYTLSFDIDGQPQPTIYQAKLTNEVVDVREDGTYLSAMSQAEHKAIIGGKVSQQNGQVITAVTTYDKFGRPLANGGDNATPASFRVANLTSFIAPKSEVKVGDEWTVAIKADKDLQTVDVTHVYKLLAIEVQGVKSVAVVEVSAVEGSGANPATAKGKFWIDAANGEMVKYEAAIGNMPTDDGGYFSGKVSIVKQ